ncbi:MAG: asparagine synthase (glutamine-hydrolyzing) [Chthoniobacter sp.]|nr:asparagine synthase (glutamine-hydrolyzing) [Chthoniobacter sp.]
MCGIAGVLSFQNEAQPLDLALLSHRGPDSRGTWQSADRRCWLGHTRLAILDLSPAGAQPMTDPATGNVIVFNGEIYNHLALRRDLAALGATFSGTSDTETLLAAYRHWGEGMLPKLKGMFAFAIHDQADGSLWLARDRFGIKPFYCRRGSDAFVFASEIRSIALQGRLRSTRDSLTAYLQWGCCPHSTLLYPDVFELPVGAHLRVGVERETKPVPYWPPVRFPNTAPPGGRPALVRRTRELLETAVHQHILSDVPVACFLSGGIDSSVITALAARELHRELHTFSVGFEDAAYDESQYARCVANRYHTDHTEIRLSSEEVIETVKEAVMKMDLPSIDGVNTYIVAQQVAKKGFKVALAGVGGDELFGGYPQFLAAPRLKYLALVPQPLLDLALRLKKGRHFLTDLPGSVDAGLCDQWSRRSWHSALLQTAGLSPRAIPIELRPELHDDFARISWSELSHYLRDMLLRDSDQMSMGVSLEVRVPFLDHELVEFLLGLPAAMKEQPDQIKSLLVEATADLLPTEIYQRKKMGFELPMPRWMRGPLETFVRDGLQHTVEQGLFTTHQTEDFRQLFLGNKLHWTKLWGIVVLGWYLHKQALQVKSN